MNSKYTVTIIVVSIVLLGCSGSDTGDMRTQPAATGSRQLQPGHLKYTAPEGWIPEQPASRMRVAQFRLPGVAGMAAAKLAVFSGISGSAEANIQRWYGQFIQPGGRATADVATVEKLTVNDLPVTVVFCTGTYLIPRSPMMMGGPVDKLSGYAMLAAIAETPNGTWHFKATGPEKTITYWRESFDDFVQSFTIK